MWESSLLCHLASKGHLAGLLACWGAWWSVESRSSPSPIHRSKEEESPGCETIQRQPRVELRRGVLCRGGGREAAPQEHQAGTLRRGEAKGQLCEGGVGLLGRCSR